MNHDQSVPRWIATTMMKGQVEVRQLREVDSTTIHESCCHTEDWCHTENDCCMRSETEEGERDGDEEEEEDEEDVGDDDAVESGRAIDQDRHRDREEGRKRCRKDQHTTFCKAGTCCWGQSSLSPCSLREARRRGTLRTGGRRGPDHNRDQTRGGGSSRIHCVLVVGVAVPRMVVGDCVNLMTRKEMVIERKSGGMIDVKTMTMLMMELTEEGLGPWSQNQKRREKVRKKEVQNGRGKGKRHHHSKLGTSSWKKEDHGVRWKARHRSLVWKPMKHQRKKNLVPQNQKSQVGHVMKKMEKVFEVRSDQGLKGFSWLSLG